MSEKHDNFTRCYHGYESRQGDWQARKGHALPHWISAPAVTGHLTLQQWLFSLSLFLSLFLWHNSPTWT